MDHFIGWILFTALFMLCIGILIGQRFRNSIDQLNGFDEGYRACKEAIAIQKKIVSQRSMGRLAPMTVSETGEYFCAFCRLRLNPNSEQHNGR